MISVEAHPGEERWRRPPEVGEAELLDPIVVPAELLARVAELEGRSQLPL
jgi:hypothetical protein